MHMHMHKDIAPHRGTKLSTLGYGASTIRIVIHWRDVYTTLYVPHQGIDLLVLVLCLFE